MKIKKMELEHEHYKNTVIHERNIYEDYLKYTGRCVYYADNAVLNDYGEHYFLALSFAPDKLRIKMIALNDLISRYEWDKAQKYFETLISDVHTIIRKQ